MYKKKGLSQDKGKNPEWGFRGEYREQTSYKTWWRWGPGAFGDRLDWKLWDIREQTEDDKSAVHTGLTSGNSQTVLIQLG